MDTSVLYLGDSYKYSHWLQYPPNTTNIFSQFMSRGGAFDNTVFYSLQVLLKKRLEGVVVTAEEVEKAEAFFAAHLGPGVFHRAGWQYIIEKHGGRLPVSIRAVPEGTSVPVKNVLMTVENTDPNCYWLTNYLETYLVQAWYGCTVATVSREMKKLILSYLAETGDKSLIGFKLHDFGYRGVSSVESAGIGASAHLVNFLGTDTVAGLLVARDYYGCPMAGHSIPAAEHSTITSWGRSRESDAYENMLNKYPTGLVAVVSDSYDIYRACKELWGGRLKNKVLSRNGTVVVRPDSGVPHEVVPEVLDILGEYFGYETNVKGYKVLDSHIRVIQGDGIDFEETGRILSAMKDRNWSADNVAFGMGGGLLQKLDRDTQKFAFKCSSAVINGDKVDVYKSPVGAPWKASRKGRLKLVANPDCGFVTLTENQPGENCLVEVFRDGKILQDWTFDQVRERAKV